MLKIKVQIFLDVELGLIEKYEMDKVYQNNVRWIGFPTYFVTLK